MKNLKYIVFFIAILIISCKSYYRKPTYMHGTERVCLYCSGTGEKECLSCGGSGSGYGSCYKCDGLGKVYNTFFNRWETCTMCHGRGGPKCFNCNGKGWKRCTFCKGKGYVN